MRQPCPALREWRGRVALLGVPRERFARLLACWLACWLAGGTHTGPCQLVSTRRRVRDDRPSVCLIRSANHSAADQPGQTPSKAWRGAACTPSAASVSSSWWRDAPRNWWHIALSTRALHCPAGTHTHAHTCTRKDTHTDRCALAFFRSVLYAIALSCTAEVEAEVRHPPSTSLLHPHPLAPGMEAVSSSLKQPTCTL